MDPDTWSLLLLIACVIAFAVGLHFLADAHPHGCDCTRCNKENP